MTSPSSISSSLFDDEDVWAEFKTELATNKVSTNAGVQGMFSKFVVEHAKKKEGRRMRR